MNTELSRNLGMVDTWGNAFWAARELFKTNQATFIATVSLDEYATGRFAAVDPKGMGLPVDAMLMMLQGIAPKIYGGAVRFQLSLEPIDVGDKIVNAFVILYLKEGEDPPV